ncbi:hypothetical protein LCGC14_1684780 [marine sediment metagenome]|uniref:Uncharacterized protein n=1 Tax=marine sediment metagenome TaxID=412755 RepID=A0A0F9KMN4_9ZZZZ
MNKVQLQEQVIPGSVGGAISIIWMTYGEWMSIIPPNMTEVKYVALTAAIGVFATALVNLVRRFLPQELSTDHATQLDGTRRTHDEDQEP